MVLAPLLFPPGGICPTTNHSALFLPGAGWIQLSSYIGRRLEGAVVWKTYS